MQKRIFTAEQIEFIRNGIKEMSTRKLAEKYSEQFEPIGQTELRRVMERNGIHNPRKENKPLPIGSERYCEYYDCMVVKVSDTSVAGMKDNPQRDKLRNDNWQLKQNYIWEKMNGRKLPWRWVVIFLDGDRMNYEPNNLYAVPLNVAGTVKKMNLDSENPIINKTALMWGELYFALKKEYKNDIV